MGELLVDYKKPNSCVLKDIVPIFKILKNSSRHFRHVSFHIFKMFDVHYFEIYKHIICKRGFGIFLNYSSNLVDPK